MLVVNFMSFNCKFFKNMKEQTFEEIYRCLWNKKISECLWQSKKARMVVQNKLNGENISFCPVKKKEVDYQKN